MPALSVYRQAKFRRAAAEKVEPFRVVSEINEITFRRELNRHYAAGSDLVDFRVGYSYARGAGEGDPVLIALVCQPVNRQPYRDALANLDRATRDLDQRREQCRREVEEARAGEGDPPSLREAI